MTKTLSSLHTSLGVRTLYDSVCFCNRCGMCAPVCPAYQLTPRETSSPRGRNQALRLVLERKIKPAQSRRTFEELILSCTLCGKCTRYCPGQIPTAQHVVALRQTLRLRLFPRTLTAFLRLRQISPRLFSALARLGLLARKIQLLWLLGFMPGFTWVFHICQLLSWRTQKPFYAPQEKSPTLIYLPSLDAQFLMPQAAQSVYQTATKRYRVTVWGNTPSGLFEYAYGNLQRARRCIRRLIARHAKTATGQLPLLTDSLDVYCFLKQAPQLFDGFPAWQQKAQQFAARVLFVTDLPPGNPAVQSPVLLMSSPLLAADFSVVQTVSQRLRTLFKKNFVECGYRDPEIFPGGYGFIKNSRAAAYGKQAAQTVAAYCAQSVFVPGVLSALELNYYLRRAHSPARAFPLALLNGDADAILSKKQQTNR